MLTLIVFSVNLGYDYFSQRRRLLRDMIVVVEGDGDREGWRRVDMERKREERKVEMRWKEESEWKEGAEEEGS